MSVWQGGSYRRCKSGRWDQLTAWIQTADRQPDACPTTPGIKIISN